MIVSGTSTGFFDLDLATKGLHPGDLVLIAGRPGAGMTSLALNIAKSVASEDKQPVAVFSTQATQEAVLSRLYCSIGSLVPDRVAMGYMSRDEWTRLAAAHQTLAETRFFIEDRPQNVLHIREKAQEVQDAEGLGLIVIDTIDLLKTEDKPFGYRLSRDLKNLAMDLRVPVICTHALPRTPDTRSDHRPRLIDLTTKFDSSLEQDPDVILFIYREEMYDCREENKGLAEIIVPKNRHGLTQTIDLAWMRDFLTFRTLHREGDGEGTRALFPDPDTSTLLREMIQHSQQNLIRLTVNGGVSPDSRVVSIFKSPQEQAFYEAAREVFAPRWPVFANVALYTLFDFERLRPTLSDAERLFFLRSSVDCVAFDERGFPRYCFELDSSHHDTDEQARRDSYKDRIFAAAGQRLYRLRRVAPEVGKEEFIRLLKEQIEGGETESVF
jgi:KaiC/GvpD/RAD55 family RecA-like ATPase